MQTAQAGAHGGASALTGYGHPRYAQSHAEFGSPRELPACGGWIIERRIPGFAHTDAMGCYPLFACRDWSRLHEDVDALEGQLVSLTLVTDPLGDYDEGVLRRCFPDLVRPFKEHFVVDLTQPRERVVSKHHRYYARKALRELSVEIHADPPAFLDSWMALHAHLVKKHAVRGVAAFSRSAFATQLSTPGVELLSCAWGAEPIAAMMCFASGDAAYAHVLGCSGAGYEKGALYALLWATIERFQGRARWLDIMGVPGADDAGADGIRQFKRGWTSDTRTAWLCGRILDRDRYQRIVGTTGRAGSSYFPDYRAGEMT